MGLTPGCGGAIIMMPMYARGYVTYGTVLSTLIATLGDSAFVLFGATIQDPSLLEPVLVVHLISFTAGASWGYGADYLEITPSRPLGRLSFRNTNQPTETSTKEEFVNESLDIISSFPREEPGTLSHRIVHSGYRVWWAVTSVGLVLGIMLIFWFAEDPNYSPEITWDISTRDGLLTWVGIIGTTLSIILYLASKSFFADDTEATIGDKLNSLDETLTHAASETAFVTFWVLSAYLVFEAAMSLGGISESDLASNGDGVMAVILAAAIGLIPGCGPQIIAITSYIEGIISFPALVANAISQDGDALFPLLVRHRTASLWATVHTLLPGLAFGLLLLWMGVDFP